MLCPPGILELRRKNSGTRERHTCETFHLSGGILVDIVQIYKFLQYRHTLYQGITEIKDPSPGQGPGNSLQGH